MRTRIATIASSLLLASSAFGQDDLSYAAISARHPVGQLSDQELARPCEVLVMLEAAHDALATSNAPGLGP